MDESDCQATDCAKNQKVYNAFGGAASDESFLYISRPFLCMSYIFSSRRVNCNFIPPINVTYTKKKKVVIGFSL